MSLGEATIRIRGDGSQLPNDATKAGREAGRQGGEAMAKETDKGFRGKIPLIVAGAAAGLAVASAAIVAGSAGLFVGIGLAAASQANQVKNAFSELGTEIKSGAMADAAAFVPVLTGLADDLGDAYRRLRPQMRDAFEATAPLVDDVADSIIDLAEEAMPSLVRMAQDADPIVAGLNTAIVAIGRAVIASVDILSAKGPEIGASIGAIGEGVAAILPPLAEMMGAGIELGAQILPPLAAALSAVASAATVLGPLLPGIGAALLAMRAARGLQGMFTGAAGSLATLAQNAAAATYTLNGFTGGVAGRASNGASRIATGFNKAADGIGRAGAALPALGVVLAFAAADMADAEAQTQRWADSLIEGGKAAADALKAYETERAQSVGPDWMKDLDEWSGFSSSMEEAQQAVREFEAALSPLELAQHKATQAQNNYQYALDDLGAKNPRTLTALRKYEAATAAAERQQSQLENAIHGVTQAMVDQANQALAAADSDLAHRMAIEDTEDALASLDDAIKEHGKSSEAAQDASLEYESALLAQANAAGVARADALGLAEGLERDGITAQATLEELVKMRTEMGDRFPQALQDTITKLQSTERGLTNAAYSADSARKAAENLGVAVHTIPGNKTVWIDTPTAEQRQKLHDLGYAVRTLPNGRTYIVAETADAERDISYVSRGRTVRLTFQTDTNGAALGGAVYRDGNGRKIHEAQGGIVEFYANGGLRPMDANIAQIVAPDTWRVIGDRAVDDEAYIPINKDPRSVAIWEEAGRRMGLLGGGGGGGGLSVTYAPAIQAGPSATAAQIAASVGQRFVRDVRLGLSGRFTGLNAMEATS